MILRDEICIIGRTLKPHGINGEISATIDPDIDIESLRCIVFDIDGIYVPFFIGSYRSRGSEAVLLTIDGVSDEYQAAKLCGLDIFALKKDTGSLDDEADDDRFYISDLIGFSIMDTNHKAIGVISDYDDSTINTLLVVDRPDGSKSFVPVADDLIDSLDIDNKNIIINMPEGLLDL